LKIAFHHIPKTAGTTLIGILEQNFSIDEIIPNKYFGKPARDVISNDISSKREDLLNFNLIRGHFPAPGFDLLSNDYYRITVLREPTSRLFSLYNDWRTKSDQSLSNAHRQDVNASQLAKQFSIGNFLKHKVHPITALFDNGQVRILSESMTKKTLEAYDLEKAKKTLDKMQLVGLTEMLDAFITILCHDCNWEFPSNYQSLNTRKYNTESLEQIDKDILHEYTKWDKQLYEYAQSLFNKKLVSHIDALKNQTSNNIKENAVSNVQLDMSKGFKSTGFHVREGIGGEHIWRWTGPGTKSTVNLNLIQHKDYNLYIDIISVIDQQIIDGIKIIFNNKELNVSHLGIVNSKQRIAAKIDRDFVNQYTSDILEIITPFTISHAEIQPETKDDRQKGVAITEINLEAQEN